MVACYHAKEHKNSRGTPRSGALGGSRELHSLPQSGALLHCGVKNRR
ncbi:hypothetical protein [Campylobacter devanensis]|nr:hypothetical protein [Campylobacter sp. P148]